MAKESKELVPHQEESGALQTVTELPDDWGLSLPREQFRTTFDLESQRGRELLYLALNEDGTQAREAINRPLEVVGITFAPQTMISDEGEAIKKIAMKLSTKDGRVIGTNSEWAVRSMLSLLGFRKTVPTEKAPWKLEIYAKQTKPTAEGEMKTCLKIRDLSLARK